MTCQFLGKSISGPFTIPSGIITVTLDTVLYLSQTIPELGMLTTKSIGPVERQGNREPVYAAIEGADGDWVNAVGLANPGCEEFAKELKRMRSQLASDKFLLISIFGGTEAEFATVAATVGPYSDALELNFSCPHAEGYGQAICATPDLATRIVRAVRAVCEKPIIPKLSPNLSDSQLESLVLSLLKEGVSGFSAVNTANPRDNPCSAADNANILTKGRGGESGPAILSKALHCVRLLHGILEREGVAATIPIIGMGGISTVDDVTAFRDAGASIFGVGSALTGLTTNECKDYFSALGRRGAGPLRAPLPHDYMRFRKFTLNRIELANPELGVFYFDENLSCHPGQFIELWIPGVGEKPFAQAMESPFCLAIRAVGELTGHMFRLKAGDPVFVRGPYGRGFTVPEAATVKHDECFVLVGGGTGIAPLLLLAEHLRKTSHIPRDRLMVYLGGRGREHIYFRDEFSRFATVRISTNDGTEGFAGFVTQLLQSDLEADKASDDRGGFHYRFFNCGPELMMKAAYDIQINYAFADVECSIERYMKCGVGICGACSCDGIRTCVDGPILGYAWLSQSTHFGKCHRAKTTKLIDW